MNISILVLMPSCDGMISFNLLVSRSGALTVFYIVGTCTMIYCPTSSASYPRVVFLYSSLSILFKQQEKT
jgi:hypothetical protein